MTHFTAEELELMKFQRTKFYQTVMFEKLKIIIEKKGYRLTRAAAYLDSDWKRIKQYLGTKQKEELEQLAEKYGRNHAFGIPSGFKRVKTTLPK